MEWFPIAALPLSLGSSHRGIVPSSFSRVQWRPGAHSARWRPVSSAWDSVFQDIASCCESRWVSSWHAFGYLRALCFWGQFVFPEMELSPQQEQCWCLLGFSWPLPCMQAGWYVTEDCEWAWRFPHSGNLSGQHSEHAALTHPCC